MGPSVLAIFQFGRGSSEDWNRGNVVRRLALRLIAIDRRHKRNWPRFLLFLRGPASFRISAFADSVSFHCI